LLSRLVSFHRGGRAETFRALALAFNFQRKQASERETKNTGKQETDEKISPKAESGCRFLKTATSEITLITDVIKAITNVIKPVTGEMKLITGEIKTITDVIKLITPVMSPITSMIKLITGVMKTITRETEKISSVFFGYFTRRYTIQLFIKL
jgi:hypothetical protein